MSRRVFKTVVIKDLKLNLFVRRALNQAHAIMLGELIEGGTKLEPILITPDNEVIDGRHRIEAHDLNQLKTIDCEVVEVESKTAMISAAYKANVGGALPPTAGDTEHTIMLLIEGGEPKKKIAELLGLPAGMARKYVDNVQSKMARVKLQKAAESVTEGGLTVVKAAEQHEVDLAKLRTFMGGNKRGHKRGIAEIRADLTRLYKSAGSKHAALLRGVIEKLEDGDMSPKQVREIFGQIEHLQKAAARTVANWKKRFEAHALSGKSSGKKAAA